MNSIEIYRALFTFGFLILTNYVTAQEEPCNKRGEFFYEEMGCQPEYEGESDCPTSYICPEYKDEDTCLFQGRFYKIGDRVDVSSTGYNCYFSCRCTGKNKISCGGSYDCIPEMHPNENCYWRKYDFKYCCFEETCEPFPSNVTCNFQGKIYRDGEIMLPKNECTRCLCKEDFNGEIEEPHCLKINCGMELFDADKIQKNCAIAYRNDRDVLCCPSDFICPSDKDQIISNNNPPIGKKCKYGDKLLNIGDSFEARAPRAGNVLCKCILPPHMTCY